VTFSGLFDLFKGLFSRAFWFGTFLPLAIFAVLNLMIAAVVFPGAVRREDWTKIGDSPLTNLTIGFVSLVVLAYAVSPLIPVFRGALDGTLLPRRLHNWLRDQRAGEARRLRAALTSARARYNQFDLMLSRRDDSLINRLRKARASGQQARGTLNEPSPNAVVMSIAELETVLEKGRGLDVQKVNAAGVSLATALETAPSDVLYRSQQRFVSLVQDARQDAYHRWLTLVARNRRLALNSPQATRIGDARAIVESYSAEVYGADFAYIWPRLQLVIANESTLNGRIATAQGQVDFAVLSLVLSILFSAIWLPLLVWHADSRWAILIFGAAMPPIVLFFYHLLFESLGTFGEVVKLVIDQHRLELLTKVLRQPLPATLFAERRLWEGGCKAEQPGTGQDLTYRHP
jgi:hypothetical protein